MSTRGREKTFVSLAQWHVAFKCANIFFLFCEFVVIDVVTMIIITELQES